jgi:hypothetical protein
MYTTNSKCDYSRTGFIKYRGFYNEGCATVGVLNYREYDDNDKVWTVEVLRERVFEANKKWGWVIGDIFIKGVPEADETDRVIYQWVNKTPPFVRSHTPPKSRPGVRDEMHKYGISGYDQMEWMIRCPDSYNDGMFVEEDWVDELGMKSKSQLVGDIC